VSASGLKRLLRRVRALLRRGALERETDEELRHHLEMERAELARGGLSPDEARRQALVAFGGVERFKEEARDARGFPWLEDLAQEIRYAFRSLRRSPAFAVVALLTISLAIGANTVVFTLVERFVFAPLPAVPESERVVRLSIQAPGGGQWGSLSYPLYRAWRDGARAFEGVAVQSAIQLSMRTDGPSQRVQGAFASSNLFEILHVRPILGRGFVWEDQTQRTTTAVISHRLWQQAFGGSPGVVGRHVMLNGNDFTVIGVAPSGFGGTELGEARDPWVPVTLHDVLSPVPGALGAWGWGWLRVVARLKPGVTLQQAAEDINALHRGILETISVYRNTRVLLGPLGDEGIAPAFRPLTGALLGVTILVLVIACANLATVLLARAVAREREIGIRLAIGVGRARLVRQMLTESLVLALGGGVLGVLIAVWAREGVRAFVPVRESPIVFTLSLDAPVLLFALAATIVTGIGFGLLPALRASRAELVPALRGGAATDPLHRSRLQSALVVTQVSLAVVSLVCAGLFVRGLQRARSVDTGFGDPGGVLLAATDLRLAGYSSDSAGVPVLERLLADVRALPGVRAASVATYLPLGFDEWGATRNDLGIEGYVFRPDESPTIPMSFVGPDYFQTVGIAVARGRGIAAEDRQGALPVAVVNEAFARRYWPGQEAVGRRLRYAFTDSWYTVVGVARDAKYGSLTQPVSPLVYLPILQAYATSFTVHLRAAGDPHILQQALRRAFEQVDPNLPVADVRTLDEHMGGALFVQELGSAMFAAFGLLALALAAVGLFGVLSHAVAQRTREIGVRLAVGATRRDVVGLVVGKALHLTVIGLGTGTALAAGAARLLRSQIFGVSPLDPVTFGGAAALLLAVALLAAWVPARRAAAVDPLVALRAD